MRRTTCAGCGSDRLEVFLDLGKTPLADRFPKTADEPEDVYPLEVAVCTGCWLVQLLEVVPDDVLWADYGFYSGTSPGKRAYHQAYAEWALREFGEQARRLTVEIGCNDGDLLQHFKAAGCDVLGIDPAEGPVEVARERGLDVVLGSFGRKDMRRALAGKAGLVIANHVAAHVADPHDFFAGISELLAPDGVAVVEVQYLPDLLAGNQFDHAYHEHRFFYSATSLERISAEHGLRSAGMVHTPQQGGSIRLGLRHGPKPPSGLIWSHFDDPNRGLEDMGVYRAFADRVGYLCDRISDLLGDELVAGRRVAGYGATAKSTTLLHACGIDSEELEYVEDTTPAKIGRVTPGTHIPIVAPGERERPDTFLLLAWNYLPGVLRRERAFLDQGGRFLVPIPVPVLL